MFTPPRTLVLNALFVALLLVQTLLPATALPVAAAPLPSPMQQEEPPLFPVMVDEPTTDPLPETAPADVATSATITPSLPATVQIALDRTLLIAQETAILTITVHGQPGADVEGMNLTLTLPTGLATSDGATAALVWPVPPLAENEPFVQIIQLQIDQPTLAGSTAVALLTAQLTAPGYLTGYWYSTLGLALSGGNNDPVQTVQQGANGAVLQAGDGLVTLLVDADAAEGETTFTYTELYRWDQEPVTMTTGTAISDAPLTVTLDSLLTTTVAVTTTAPLTSTAADQYHAHLPIIENESSPAEATSVAPVEATTTTDNPQKPKSKKDEGVDLYYSWQFDAVKNNQEVKEFKKPVKVMLSLTKLAAAGLDPASVQLWTRKKEKMRWTPVKTDYDAEQQALIAWLPHFSQFGLGAGLSQRGDILPSVIGFMTDRLTGGVSLQYPIETPAGVGGLNPNLSFAYSSVSADDLFLDSGSGYLSQSSGLGLGWSVAGSTNFIVRTDNKLDNNTADTLKTFSLVLNGMRVGIRFEESEWRTDPETFYRVVWDSTSSGNVTDWGGWTLVAPDGTKYEFGDSNAFGGNANTVSTSPTVTYLETSTGGTVYRLANQWYLRRVRDPIGNEIVYQYKTEKGTITTNDCMGSIPSLDRWYTAAVYPDEILWNQNSSQALNAGLRVLFTYNTATRDDYRILYHEPNDCHQVKFALNDRLSSVKVQAKISGSWVTQRTYTLGNSYRFTQGATTDYLYTATNGGSSVKRLLLHYLDVLGQNDALLQRYSFTYQLGDTDANSPYKYNPNQVYLVTADNGWGGKITYTLLKHRVGCHSSICGGIGTRDARFAVTQTRLEDGLGNSIYTSYSYSSTTPASGSEWGHIGKEDGSATFFGFQRSEATYYATVSGIAGPSTVLKWDAQDAWPPMRSDSDNPDPRVGKLKRIETRLSSGGTVVAVTNYHWQSYRRVNNAWVFTDASKLVVNNNTTYPVIWVRQESEDTWTAGGNWNSGSYAIDSSGGSGKQTKTTYDNTASYRGYGNVTQVEELSHSATSVTQATWNSAVSGGTLLSLRKTKTDYSPNTTAYIVNKPTRVLITDGADGCNAETRYIYGAIYSGGIYLPNTTSSNYTVAPLNNGLLTKSQQALGSCTTTASIADTTTSWAITRISYDAYGNQNNINQLGNTVSQNLVISTTYDSTYHLFPVSQNLNGSTTYVETARYYGVNEITGHGGATIWGAVQEHCGVNEVCVRQTYDQFGRRERRWEGVGKGNSWGVTNNNALVEWAYTPYDGTQTANTVREWRNPRTEGNFVRRLYNGFGQLIQEQRPYQDWTTGAGQEVMVDYLYDAFGNQSRVGVPRLVAKYSSGDIRRAAAWGSGYTQTTYDALTQVVQTIAPNGEQQQYNYLGRAMSIVGIGRNGDSNKMLKWQQVDGLGYPQLIQTHNPNGSSWTKEGEIAFSYYVTGDLNTVTHAGSAGTTTLTYDIGGRKTEMIDPDLGTWTYDYDRQGKLTRQTDARGKTICLYYDGLARLVSKDFNTGTSCPATSGNNVTYAYDQNHSSSNRSRGQLTTISNGAYTRWLYYDGQGLLYAETSSISGAPQYDTTYYGYDSYLRPTTVTYPGGEVVTTGYNSMGLPSTLSSSFSGTVIDSVTYDAAGRLTQRRAALSNLYYTQTYWPWTGSANNTNGRLKEIRLGTSSAPATRLYLLYGYDSFGNIGGMTEQYNAGAASTYSFCYDAQNRLVRGYAPYDSTKTCSTYTTGRTYSYDSAGRLTNYEGTAMTVVRGHSTFPTGAYSSFDNNGNYTALGASQTLSWDHENRLASISGGTNESYLYDPDGQRVKKSNSTETVYYANQFYEVKNGVAAKYYFFNGSRVATRQGSGPLMYLYSDHLGSTVYTTHDGGTFINEQGYYAYGRYRRGGAIPTDHKFTGQKLDGSGLQYFNARYYNPDSGQFLSPDTIVPDPGNLFDYNRYAYARLNPMKYNDPTGHQSCMAMAPAAPLVLGCQVVEFATRYGPTVVQLASQWMDKLPAVDWLFSNTAEQGGNSAGQQNAGNSSTGDPFDPKDPLKSFRNRGMGEQSVKDVQKATQNGVDPAKMFQQYNDLLNKGVDMTGHALEQAQQRNIPTQKIADTFTGAARNTQYFWDGSRVAQWSPHTNVAVIIEKATKQVVTVFERTSPQRDWQSMSAFEVMKWLDK